MDNLNNIIEEIKAVYTNNKLIPFIGSGFSKPLELPDWKQLVQTVAKDIPVDSDLLFLHMVHMLRFLILLRKSTKLLGVVLFFN